MYSTELSISLQVDLGMFLFQRVDAFPDRSRDHDVARALRALDRQRHHRLALEAGEGAAVGHRVGDRSEIIEPDLATGRQADHRSLEVAQGARPGQGADRLVATADLGAAAGDVDIGAAQPLADVKRGQPDGLQSVLIERDQNLPVDTADALDEADATDTLQFAFDNVVDEPRQILRRLAGRDRGVGQDRRADHVDALDQSAR